MVQIACPNCGDHIDLHAGVRMLTCPSCGTTLLYDDAVVKQAGDAGVMHDAPLLFGIGDRVACAPGTFDILGHARFSYGRGWWDEFWALDTKGQSAWLSIDEGDVAVQRSIRGSGGPKAGDTMRPGDAFTHHGTNYRVTEIDRATCIALRGEFDEALSVGETYTFLNALSGNGKLLSGEFQDGPTLWFEGHWIDPFEIVVERRP
ncbi:hypothetical protein GCM10011360_20830 [Primorskyibacter flagellatus]|uniref:DUF4178 domain-containing protein n=1 Tax=Primorskyibacter flagellatus TaxID=1387277 RepID=A0A917A783_9RHOB|nr:DUF4178 domain-containing protein [Primorskyibacter flagellatus]GGE32807.1 hypothetical protein GCM10011360_20830 [Primorskyibacter flagellatus]